MGFTNEQIASLEAPLARKHVKGRNQGGRQVSYIEGWHVIAEANRIFGFDGWDRTTEHLERLVEPYQDQKGNWRVAFGAKVKVRVYASDRFQHWVTREGSGYGSGIARDLGDAYESAIKEAETDAMKRALMTFGNPFGLALYDKEQAHVSDEPRDAAPAAPPRQASAAQVGGAPPAPPAASIRERAAPQPPNFERPKSREEAAQDFIKPGPSEVRPASRHIQQEKREPKYFAPEPAVRETLPPNDAEAVLNTLRLEMSKIRASGDLVEWAKKSTVRDMVDMLPDDAAHGFREEYKTRLAELRLAVVGAG